MKDEDEDRAKEQVLGHDHPKWRRLEQKRIEQAL
jgi:hypothetical protein